MSRRVPGGRRAALVVVAGAALAYRRWHLCWGATRAEVDAEMPGDTLLVRAPFRSTRAITIAAPASAVWPWLVQIGAGRAGFYSYDRLDNHGRPSSEMVMGEFQHVAVGDVAAPMTVPSDETTSFVVFGFETDRWLGWTKPGSTWVWQLAPIDHGRGTRLVVRLADAYAMPRALLGAPLVEIADFPMMRKELLGIKRRAESLVEARSPAAA